MLNRYSFRTIETRIFSNYTAEDLCGLLCLSQEFENSSIDWNSKELSEGKPVLLLILSNSHRYSMTRSKFYNSQILDNKKPLISLQLHSLNIYDLPYIN